MAISPSHRFGQIIGEVLETAVTPLLEQFSLQNGLYLDKKGVRPCRAGKKCSWTDLNNNSHDLDFVLERGGSADKKGTPAAFIETAWRRYTKHSRNKVQEIQGAIVPLVQTYRNSAPFQGAILAGVFTTGALTQLRSLGFTVLYFPYETVVKVFKKFGLDASFDEATPDSVFQEKVNSYEALSTGLRQELAYELVHENKTDVDRFMSALTTSVSRQIDRISILPLHGRSHDLTNVKDAIQFVRNYKEDSTVNDFQRYEIHVRYNNDNRVEGIFADKQSAIEFLQIFQPVVIV